MPQHLTIQLNESDDAEDESEDKEEELKTPLSKVSNIHAQWINKLDASPTTITEPAAMYNLAGLSW